MKKKQNILLEAAVNYNSTLISYSSALKEMMNHKAFESVKGKFEAIEEVNLFESLTAETDMDEVLGPNPVGEKHINLSGIPGPGQYGTSTKPLGRLRDAIKAAQMDSFESVNELSEKLERVVDAADPVIAILDSGDLVAEKEAKILLAKLYLSLSNMFKIVTEKAKELRMKLVPAGFDIEEARNLMKNSNLVAAAADAEVTADSTKEKPGFFRNIMNRLSGSRK